MEAVGEYVVPRTPRMCFFTMCIIVMPQRTAVLNFSEFHTETVQDRNLGSVLLQILVALLRSTGRQHLLRRASQIERRRLELWAFGGSRCWMLSQRPLLIAVASHHKDTVLDWFW